MLCSPSVKRIPTARWRSRSESLPVDALICKLFSNVQLSYIRVRKNRAHSFRESNRQTHDASSVVGAKAKISRAPSTEEETLSS